MSSDAFFNISGGVVHTLGISPLPVCLVGPVIPEALVLQGYIELSQPSLGIENLRQTEYYDVRLDNKKSTPDNRFYSGSHIISHDTVNPDLSLTRGFSMRFETRLELRRVK